MSTQNHVKNSEGGNPQLFMVKMTNLHFPAKRLLLFRACSFWLGTTAPGPLTEALEGGGLRLGLAEGRGAAGAVRGAHRHGGAGLLRRPAALGFVCASRGFPSQVPTLTNFLGGGVLLKWSSSTGVCLELVP